MITRKNINSELENLRKCVSTAASTEDLSKVLLRRTARIHASYLFHPFGQRVLQDICSTISSTGTNNQINGWKDLAGHLGLTFHQIGCIQNYNYIDNTELVLMAYAQGDNSSLSEILKTLLYIQRPDAVSKAQKSINNMVDAVLMLHNQNEQDFDNIDNNSNNNLCEITRRREFLLRPNNYSRIKQELPITLRELTSCGSSSPVVVKSPHQITLPSIQSVTLCQRSAPFAHSSNHISSNSTSVRTRRNNLKAVFLTFADDGREIAHRVAKQLREDRLLSYPIGVVILDEQEKYVSANAEHFIIRCFAQADYVMPVVTPGYLKLLNGGQSVVSQSALCSLDSRYVCFIHDLMIKYYIDNQCRNSKIRCVMPHSSNKKLVESMIMKGDPTLRIWIHESEVDNFISRISIKK